MTEVFSCVPDSAVGNMVFDVNLSGVTDAGPYLKVFSFPLGRGLLKTFQLFVVDSTILTKANANTTLTLPKRV